jgi:hypothetical protein
VRAKNANDAARRTQKITVLIRFRPGLRGHRRFESSRCRDRFVPRFWPSASYHAGGKLVTDVTLATPSCATCFAGATAKLLAHANPMKQP